MRRPDFGRYALFCSVAAALLSGCSGSQPPIGAPFTASSTRLTAQRPAARGTFKVLYSFSGSVDGGGPSGLLNVGDLDAGPSWARTWPRRLGSSAAATLGASLDH